jgi:hypothetical protein
MLLRQMHLTISQRAVQAAQAKKPVDEAGVCAYVYNYMYLRKPYLCTYMYTYTYMYAHTHTHTHHTTSSSTLELTCMCMCELFTCMS